MDAEENVGIGTTYPTGKLHVDGGKAADDTDGSNIVIKAQDGGDVELFGGGRPGGDIILLPGKGGLGGEVLGQSGKVGIGTENPEVMLDVRGNVEVDRKIQAHDAGGLHLATDEGTIRILISDTGKVGIGTTTPESKLHIEQSAGACDEGIRLSYGGHEWDIAADYGGERLHIIRDQNSTEGLVIRNGKVGIGTTDPAGQVGLDAYQGGTVGSAVAGHNKQLVLGGEYNTGFNTGSSVKLLISDYDNNTDANIYPIYCEDEQNRVDFYVRKQEGSVSTEYFGGNVGIGTKNPRSKLSVGGDGDQYVSIYSF